MTELRQLAGRKAVAAGALVTAASQAYRVILNFASGVVLARLLTPADFGLVAMVSTSLTFVALIQDLGLNQATIQRARISGAQMSALFWLSLGSSVILAVILAASAPAIASFFGDLRLIPLTVAFSALVIVGGAQSQQLALLSRDMRFKSLAIIDILAVTSSAVAGVVIAWLTSSYWALFVSSLVFSVVSLGGAWILCAWRPGRPSFDGEFRQILSFGSGVSAFNIVNYFARNADSILIGRFYGAEPLGLYNRAYRLLLFPILQIQGPLGRVMLPLLARLQSDPERYRKAYAECMTLLLIASHPGLIFAIIFAEEVFLLLLGPSWVPAAQIFRWLGIAGLYHMVSSPTGWLFLSQGRAGDFFWLGLYNAITIVGAVVAGLPWGPVGVAASYAMSEYFLRVPVTFVVAGRRGPITARELWVIAGPHVFATVVGGCVLFAAARVIPSPGAGACLFIFVLSYAVYCLVLIIFPGKRRILFHNLRTLRGLTSIGRRLKPIDKRAP
jgi:polysaccharide transporter, PST family